MLKVENLPCIGEKMGSFRGEGAKAMLKEIIELINKTPNDSDQVYTARPVSNITAMEIKG